MSDNPKRSPVLIELESPAPADSAAGPRHETRDEAGHAQPNPADAPPIGDPDAPLPRPRTMEMVTRLVGRPPSPMTRLFINSGVALFVFLLTMAALDFIGGLLDSYPLLGWIGIGLLGLFTLASLGMAWREYRAWARFARIDAIQRQAGQALAENSTDKARRVIDQLLSLYRPRPDLKWGHQRVTEARGEAYDARSLITMAETELMAQLDQEARREIEAAARTVAAATALIPLALADVAAALAANLRMIRRMAEIYGGRAGTVGSWRLARTVMTHLVATGAVAAGDDLIHTVAGGGVLAKLSRRFGEGVVNGALTARVGIAAMEVCRPLPFLAQPRPKVGNLVARGLRGLFGSDDGGR
ncbi:YcjF family protein [Paracoccus alkanivorans]|uniref:TIGR01620 family protein n=1 Tax=Paracoccus alkanivorans TaxID=2116655 RepID=A0A3M0MFA6_9RHOB|nr:TIGR01620 family protein [Paracoccus alkanivorans]RMC36249.1 TIGR01620 family protein [Paracoccus alkanivorans]